MANVLHMLHSLDAEPGNPASTVRLGDKWSYATAIDKKLKLCVCEAQCLDPDKCGKDVDNTSCDNCTIEGEGQVTSTWTGKFYNIPARLIEYEHEVRSRSYSGLLASMKFAYGEKF